MKIVTFIQARMSSKRLPGKVMRPLYGQPMLGRVVELARQIGPPVYVLTSTHESDDVIVEWASNHSVDVFRGALDDVLGRFVGMADRLALGDDDKIVRLTADCPLLDPNVSEQVIGISFYDPRAYCTNTLRWPDGMDTELFSAGMLRESHQRHDLSKFAREHVTTALIGRYKHRNTEGPGGENLRRYKWSVDTEEDLLFVQAVYNAWNGPATWQQVLATTPEMVCELCADNVPHVQRSRTSIGGPRDYTVWDLHETEVSGGAGIEECPAWPLFNPIRGIVK